MFKRIPWKTTWRNKMRGDEPARCVFIGMGSNIGTQAQRKGIFLRALNLMEVGGIGRVVAVSSLYETPPWGKTDQDNFSNAVIAIETPLKPIPLLKRLKSLERRLGRKSRMRWGPREIDLDILLMGNIRVEAPGLTIPHKSILQRPFVLVPLREIYPDAGRILTATRATSNKSS